MESVIFGAGSYGKVYLAYLQQEGVDIVGFIDDNKDLWGTDFMGVKVLGSREILPSLIDTAQAEAIYCPLGNNKVRAEILAYAKKIGYKTPNFIHAESSVAPCVEMGEGVYILPSIVMPYVTIRDYVMMSAGSVVGHHTTLGEGVFISNGVSIGGNINIKPQAYVGIGSTLMTGIKAVGENSLVGAGAVVIRDVPDAAVVVGNPAKVIRYK